MATVRFSIKPHWLSETVAGMESAGAAGGAAEKDDSKVKVPRDIEHRQKWKRALVDLLEVRKSRVVDYILKNVNGLPRYNEIQTASQFHILFLTVLKRLTITLYQLHRFDLLLFQHNSNVISTQVSKQELLTRLYMKPKLCVIS